MSGKICGMIFDNGPLERDMRFVLLAIGERADAKGYAFPLIQDIAKRTLFTREYVGKTVKKLISMGWMEACEHPSNHRASAFKVNLEKLAIYEPISHEKSSCELVTDSHVNSVPISCEQSSEPLQPLNCVTAINRQIEPFALADAAPSRHSEFRKDYEAYFQHKNRISAPWDGKEANQLSRWLKANPSITREQWQTILRNRARSDVPQALPLSNWIGRALTWLNQETDSWGGVKKNGKQRQGKGHSIIEAAQHAISSLASRTASNPGDGTAGQRGLGNAGVFRSEPECLPAERSVQRNQQALPYQTAGGRNGLA